MPKSINFDQRRVKLIDGAHTVETGAERERVHNICDGCGRQSDCDIRREFFGLKERTNAADLVKMRLTTCSYYALILTFRPPLEGMEDVFNTFRIGAAWHGRVEPGTTVMFGNVETGKIFGSGVVKSRHVGLLPEMLRDHAHENHLMEGTPRLEAPEALHKIMRNLYGSNFAASDRRASVIYVAPDWLERDDVQKG